MAKGFKGPGMGAPKKFFDWDFVDSLLRLNASLEYICEELIKRENQEINIKTLNAKKKFVERRIREKFDLTFVDYKSKRLEPKRLSLFKKQYDVAMSGNVTMLIWLGKQLLGQTDVEKSEVKRISNEIDDINEKVNLLTLVK